MCCQRNVSVTLKQLPSDLTATAVAPNVTCKATNGTITVTALGGTPPYSYSLNGGTPQSSNIFTGLTAGSYKVNVKDNGGCSVDLDVQFEEICCTVKAVATAPEIRCDETQTTITVTTTSGVGPFLYAINGGSFQLSNTFVVSKGTYKISVKEANGSRAAPV